MLTSASCSQANCTWNRPGQSQSAVCNITQKFAELLCRQAKSRCTTSADLSSGFISCNSRDTPRFSGLQQLLPKCQKVGTFWPAGVADKPAYKAAIKVFKPLRLAAGPTHSTGTLHSYAIGKALVGSGGNDGWGQCEATLVLKRYQQERDTRKRVKEPHPRCQC